MRRFALRHALIACGYALLAAGHAPVRSAPVPTFHAGTCDASAVVALDQGRFLVASDEDNVLRVYRIGEGGAPEARSADLSVALRAAPTRKGHREIDIEGAARLGDRILWIGSHGRSRQGDPRPSRRRLFAVRVRAVGGLLSIEPEPGVYDGLLDDLEAFLEANPQALPGFDLTGALARAPGDGNNLDIEGLAGTDDGGLWIGFRAPLIDGNRAVLVHVDEIDAALSGEGSLSVIGAAALDLGGRGVRSLTRVPALGYLVVAGPAGKGGGFALYGWNPDDEEPTLLREMRDLPAGFNPEALLHDARHERWYLVSDDGSLEVQAGGERRPCKRWDDRQDLQGFRVLEIPEPTAAP